MATVRMPESSTVSLGLSYPDWILAQTHVSLTPLLLPTLAPWGSQGTPLPSSATALAEPRDQGCLQKQCELAQKRDREATPRLQPVASSPLYREVGRLQKARNADSQTLGIFRLFQKCLSLQMSSLA